VKSGTSRTLFARVLVVVICVWLGACAGRRGAAGPDEPSALALPTDMVLMPITDERPPGPDAVDISRDVRNVAVRLFRKRGYVATPRDQIVKEGLAAPTTLRGVSGADLAALGPSDAGPLIFIAVDRVDEGYGYGGNEYRVVLSAVIVDVKTGRIVWQGAGSGSTALGGFLRIFSPQSQTYDAVYEAVRDLLRPLPKSAGNTADTISR
jgi:hypothetical protein